jgi:hypothetical protein
MNRYTGSMVITLISLYTLILSTPLMAAVYGDGMSDMGMNGGAITIIAPEQGQTFKDGTGITLQYKVQLSSQGDHLHVYVDNGNPIIVRMVSGCPCSIKLPDLVSGIHMVRIKEATSSHALTSIESDISFTVK